MALYADENFPLRVIEELRRLGHDVITAFEDGRANQSVTDHAILVRATELGRAILTSIAGISNTYIFKCQIMRELLSVPKIQIVSVKRNGLPNQLIALKSWVGGSYE